MSGNRFSSAAALIGILLNPTNPNAERQLKDVQEVARAIGQQIHIVHASSERDLAAAFATLAQLRAGALLVGADPFFNSRRNDIVGRRHATPFRRSMNSVSTSWPAA